MLSIHICTSMHPCHIVGTIMALSICLEGSGGCYDVLAALCLTPRYDLLASADSYVASRPCLAHSALLPASDSRCGMHPFATVGQRSDMRGRNVHSVHQELPCATPASQRRRRTQSPACYLRILCCRYMAVMYHIRNG